MVLTQVWMYNVDGQFDKKSRQLTVSEIKFRLPIEAITKVNLSMVDDKITFTVTTDVNRANVFRKS